jgi:ribonuclease HII
MLSLVPRRRRQIRKSGRNSGKNLTNRYRSKKLNAAEREHLATEIKRTTVAWSVSFAEVSEIDTINIYWASQLAMKRAVAGLLVRPGHVLVDGRRIKDMEIAQQAIIKGDAKSLTIAAASILAKTARDALMHNLDLKHPGYGFAKHKGYPVPEHIAALKVPGACSIHRTSFGPVRSILGLPPLPPWPERAFEIAGSAGESDGDVEQIEGDRTAAHARNKTAH